MSSEPPFVVNDSAAFWYCSSTELPPVVILWREAAALVSTTSHESKTVMSPRLSSRTYPA